MRWLPWFYRSLGSLLLWLVAGMPQVQAEDDSAMSVQRIAFGSCADQQKPCPIWGTIADFRPDWLLLLGDNIYADVVDGRLKPSTPQRIAAAYDELGKLPDFQRLRQQTRILATWDDHDYGNNDAGVEWEHKDAAATIFHDFFGTPPDSPLRDQRGIYDARIVGPPGQRVQMIMLDTRYFRSTLDKADRPLPGFRARPYIPRNDPTATMLGEAQWQWLEEQLRKPAEVRLIGSSIQVISDEHPFEKWDNFPAERQRLYDLIQQCEASGVVILSGDRHRGEISMDIDAVGYPLYDITASGFNQASATWREPELNRHRVASLDYGNHFGSIVFDWDRDDPLLALQLRHEDGEIAVQTRVPLSRLQAGPAAPPRPAGVLSAVEALAAQPGQVVSVQITVRGGRAFANPARLLLNSQEDYRSTRNFTVAVEGDALSNVSLEQLRDRTIQVEGTLTLYNGVNQIQVSSPGRLQVVSLENAAQ